MNQIAHWIHRASRWLLRLICHPALLEEVEGDLEEAFYHDSRSRGRWAAAVAYLLTVLGSIRPYMFRNRFSVSNHLSLMFRSLSLVTTWRVLRRQKVFTLLHLSGLSIGMTCAMLVALYITYELSYSTSIPAAKEIYRVNLHEGESGIAITPNIVGPLMARELPAIDQYARVMLWGNTVFTLNGESWKESTYFVDSTFLPLFQWQVLAGNPIKTLAEPKTVAITEKMARQYFPDKTFAELVGESLMIEGTTPYRIDAVIADPPKNSDLQFSLLTSFKSLSWAQEETWNNASFHTYIRLKPGTDAALFEQQLTKLASAKQAGVPEERRRMPYLQPFADIHLSTGIDYDFSSKTDAQYLYTFGGIALLILLIACINYVNLATAKATERAREVGVKKVLGAQKFILFSQFFLEALLVVLVSFGVALLLAGYLLPYLNNFIGKSLSMWAFFTWQNSLGIATALLLIAFLSGAYPSLLLTSFHPLTIIRKNYRASKAGIFLRRSLVTLQFAASVFLLIAAFTVREQLGFIQQKNMGFDKQVLSHYMVRGKMGDLSTYRKRIMRIAGVNQVSFASDTPEQISSVWGMKTGPKEEDYAPVYLITVDEHYLETCKITLKEGRNFTPASGVFIDGQDDVVAEYVVNQPALNALGMTAAQAVGQVIEVSGQRGTVIGVTEDFHFESLKEDIEPLIIAYNPDRTWRMLVNFDQQQTARILPQIEAIFKELAPNFPFDYRFLSDTFAERYRLETQLGVISGILSAIAIIVACLGLVGLTSFTTHQRAKEISIRKVLGASSGSIMALLSHELFLLLTLAIAIALPLAYLYMNQWLNDYAFHIELNWWMALPPIALIGIFTFATVSYILLRSARANPARNLRTE